MDEFTRKAEMEIVNLTNELLQIANRKRVIELKISGLKAYMAAEAASTNSPNQPTAGFEKPSNFYQAAQARSVKARIIGSALRILGDGRTCHTEELIEQFEKEDIAIGGASKPNTVSSILSRDARFKADRKLGWSLRKRESLAANEAFDLQPTP